MARHPGYRFAAEWQRNGRPAAAQAPIRFLRIGRTHEYMVTAGLFRTPDDEEQVERPEEVLARASELPGIDGGAAGPDAGAAKLGCVTFVRTDGGTARPGRADDRTDAGGEITGEQTLDLEEALLVLAYARLDVQTERALSVYVPETLRPWSARVHLNGQDTDTLIYTMARTTAGARWSAACKLHLMALADPKARFGQME